MTLTFVSQPASTYDLKPLVEPGVSVGTGGGGLLGTVDEETAMMGQREEIKGVDIIYFKNVMLKFLEANSEGRTDQVFAPPLFSLSRFLPGGLSECLFVQLLERAR